MHAALADRLPTLTVPSIAYRTVVLPSYHGVRQCAHLTPLLALLLKSFGIPVLIHGVLDGGGGTAAAYVLRELGVLPCSNVAQVNTRLCDEGMAFAPVALLNSGLASLLALRARLGVESIATRLAVLADVMGAESVRVTPPLHNEELPGMAATLTALGGCALLLKGCEGVAFADPQLRPEISFRFAPRNKLPAPYRICRQAMPVPRVSGCGMYWRVTRGAVGTAQSARCVPIRSGLYRGPESGACDHVD